MEEYVDDWFFYCRRTFWLTETQKKILNVVFWTLQEQNILLDLNIWNEMFLHSVFSFVEDGIVRLSTYSTSSEGCTVKCNLESEVFGENSI